MSELLLYAGKSKAMNHRLTVLLREIEAEVKEGKIHTVTEYNYRLKQAVVSFLESIGTSTMKVRKAYDVASSSDYNAMIEEAMSDMQYLMDDIKELTSRIDVFQDQLALDRDMIQQEITYLQNRVSSIKNNTAANASIMFTEQFTSTEYFGNIESEEALTIETGSGVLMLPCLHGSSTDITKLHIDPEQSNGLIGTSHLADTMNGDIHFEGQDGLHNDPSVLLDGIETTWVDFERFFVSDAIQAQCNRHGFGYVEDVSWITEENEMQIVIDCVMDDPNRKLSWITIQPHFSDAKGSLPCIIKSVVATTVENNGIELILANRYLNETLLLPLDGLKIKSLRIVLYQPYAYPVMVGHFYVSGYDPINTGIGELEDAAPVLSRVEGKLPTLSTLGLTYDPQSKWVKYPDLDTNFPDETFVKKELFTCPNDTVDCSYGLELIPAQRYYIGLSKLSAMCCTYKSFGTYVSNTFHSDLAIAEITMDAKEYIPDGTSICYYISIDNGCNWHPIFPRHRCFEGVYRYTINCEDILYAMSPSVSTLKNLYSLTDIHDVKIKIEMVKEEQTDECCSPILYQYQLHLKAKKDVI